MKRRGYLLWLDGLAAIMIALALAGVLFSSQPVKSPGALDAHYLASDIASVLSNAYEPQVAAWASGAPIDASVANTLESIAQRHGFTCLQIDVRNGAQWSSLNCGVGWDVLASASVTRGVFVGPSSIATIDVNVTFVQPLKVY